MTVVPISCQSEGALEVYIEPVLPAPHLVVVGRSPMAHTLADLARRLGWRADRLDWTEFSAAGASERSMVVVATQGHGDEEAIEQAVAARPAYLGLVGSRKRGAAVLGYLAERVQLKAAGQLARAVPARQGRAGVAPAAEAADPVCGMTVATGPAGRPLEYEGATYYFCCAGCRNEFESNAASYA